MHGGSGKMAKKIPERKCMGCNRKLPKNELLRIVRSPEGEVSVDSVGKLPGRGVYICSEPKCFERVKKSKRLETVLEVHIPDEVYLEAEKVMSERQAEKEDG